VGAAVGTEQMRHDLGPHPQAIGYQELLEVAVQADLRPDRGRGRVERCPLNLRPPEQCALPSREERGLGAASAYRLVNVVETGRVEPEGAVDGVARRQARLQRVDSDGVDRRGRGLNPLRGRESRVQPVWLLVPEPLRNLSESSTSRASVVRAASS
jgi:hypothetical protein